MPPHPPRTCPIPGCDATIPRLHLMCSRHWYTVPGGLRRRVWREYRTATGSEAHLQAIEDATRAAIRATRGQA